MTKTLKHRQVDSLLRITRAPAVWFPIDLVKCFFVEYSREFYNLCNEYMLGSNELRIY